MNLPTIIVGLIVAAIFITVVVKEIKKHKKGDGCSCGCAGCSMNCECCKDENAKIK